MIRSMFVIAAWGLLVAAAGLQADDWYVDDDNCPGPGTGFPYDPFCTIQQALDAANPGDEIRVWAGVYAGPGNVDLDFAGKDITLLGADGPQSVIIDGGLTNRALDFHSGETSAALVKWFTIRNCDVDDQGGAVRIVDSSPTFYNCWFIDNTSIWGGALYLEGTCPETCAPHLEYCRFEGNYSYDRGGAIRALVASPTFLGVSIVANESNTGAGGAYFENCTGQVDHSTFYGNTAGYDAGGVECFGSTMTFQDVYFSVNTAGQDGGGFVAGNSSVVTLRNCLFFANTGAFSGGLDASNSDVTLTNCLFQDNSSLYLAGAMFFSHCDPVLTNCTVAQNDTGSSGAGGLYCQYSNPTIVNSIFWANAPQQMIAVWSSTPQVSYSLLQGGWPGGSNIITDHPRFGPGPIGRLYLQHLAAGQNHDSPCIDAGIDTPETVGLDQLTTRRDEVVDAGPVDVGYHYRLAGDYYIPGDTNFDQQVDLADFAFLQRCYTGPDGPDFDLDCWRIDFDTDDDVDADDYAQFLTLLTGPVE